MDPIPIFFSKVKRSAITIKGKKPFKDWLVSIDAENDMLDLMNEPDVYLLPYFDDPEELEIWMSKNFDPIFVDQMNNWYIDEKLWSQKRTYKTFKEWFDFSLYTSIWDTLDKPISKV